MINFSKELNPDQLKIIEDADDYALVLAGAGSGKTRVITYRVAYLLDKKTKIENILLLTFTNKAANEMTERIMNLTGQKEKIPWSGTFHHIAYKILKNYAHLIGYQNNFTVIDSEDAKDLIKLCIKEEGIESTYKKFPSAKIIQNIISYAKNSNSPIEDVLNSSYQNYSDFLEKISRVASVYVEKKKLAGMMDFDDLLINLFFLFSNKKEIREKIASQFEYVLVDEYQDINKIQSLLVEQFSSIHKNLLVVGDDAQSIYSFRAAEIQNILDFEKKFDAKVFKLETNYRSTPEILNLANEVIKNNFKQYEKKLTSVQEFFTRPELHAFSDNLEEAEFIVKRILELKKEGINLNKIAVLFRAAFHSQILEMELVKRDINYDFRGGLRFFERAHVKDILAFLKILNNKNDSLSFYRILSMYDGIGPVTLKKIISLVQASDKLDDVVFENIKEKLSFKAQIGWSEFWQIFSKIIKMSSNKPKALIKEILDSDYQEYLKSEYSDFRERLEDLKQMIFFADKYEDLNTFLVESSLQEGFNRKKDFSKIDNKNDQEIVLSTIHQSKGLEWDVVFIIGLAQGLFPSERIKNSKELEEERRLFYVSITRAKKYLYLSYPLSSKSFMAMTGPSLFLQEINLDLLDNNSNLDNFSTNFFDVEDEKNNKKKYTIEDSGRTNFLKSIDEL